LSARLFTVIVPANAGFDAASRIALAMARIRFITHPPLEIAGTLAPFRAMAKAPHIMMRGVTHFRNHGLTGPWWIGSTTVMLHRATTTPTTTTTNVVVRSAVRE
jgi:hypothetical protein